jgi:hypothetical protein
MEEDIRKAIKKDLLDLIKKASTEEERSKVIQNFQEFAKAEHVEALTLGLLQK